MRPVPPPPSLSCSLIPCGFLVRTHPRTLITRGVLASLRGQTGDRAAAVAAFEALLTDCLRVLGPDHSPDLNTRFYRSG
jgi:hypothetical protein